jgi:hypothetical protein
MTGEETHKSSLGWSNVAEDGDYTVTPTKVRVWQYDIPDDEGHQPWVIDAMDEETGFITEDLWFFDSHAEAIAATPEFIKLYPTLEGNASS